MRFLVDHDVYYVTIERLIQWGHDVVTVKDLKMHTASDHALLEKALGLDRLFVTRDKGFGALTFLASIPQPGVILLRISPRTVEEAHKVLESLLKEQSEQTLKGSFTVVEPHRHRIRSLD